MAITRTNRLVRLFTALALCLWAGAARADFQTVSIPSVGGAGDPPALTAYLMRPEGSGPFPAVVALHGCGGLFGNSGKMIARHREWGETLAKAGYVVLFPDSFTPRSVHDICQTKSRDIQPGRERARDAYAALKWLRSQNFVKSEVVGLLGWSNGGSTVLGAIDTH